MFFFFKQKTAYEMRISDWSSDVCSSELRSPEHSFLRPDRRAAAQGIAHLLPPLQRHAFGQPARHLILHAASLIRRHGRQSALTTAGGALPSPSRCATICAASRPTPRRIAPGRPAQPVPSPAMHVQSTSPTAPPHATNTPPPPVPTS